VAVAVAVAAVAVAAAEAAVAAVTDRSNGVPALGRDTVPAR
jgi:hypothetical protein